MILPYTLRFVCLCFAAFFLTHVAAGTLTWIASRKMIQTGETMQPETAARFLLGLRLLPGTVAFFVVGGLCVPSYLLLEANAAGEKVSAGCCIAALLGALVFSGALLRGAKALWISAKHARQCRCEGHAAAAPDENSSVIVMNAETPVMALTGVIRQRIIVSCGVLRALSGEELEAALEHERAHSKSHDNFKRLLLVCAPEILPFSRAFAALDRAWARFTEWAADDDAVAGDLRRSISLAAALVNIARLGAASSVPPLASSLLEHDDELSMRIERLLGVASVRRVKRGGSAALMAAAAAVAIAAVLAMLQPATLSSVHVLLEHLVR